MGIYQKLKFFIGKVTVLIMAVIFPFAVGVYDQMAGVNVHLS